jgi:hypothetical protein
VLRRLRARARRAPPARGALAQVMGGYGESDEDEGEDPTFSASAGAGARAPQSRGHHSVASVPDDSFFDSKAAAATARGEKAKTLSAEEALARFEEDVRADVEEATRREQEEMEADALEKIRREGEEHAERLGKVARLKRRAEEKRAEAAKRKKTNAEKTARVDGDAAETSRAVLSAGDTSDSDSDAPSRGGLAMDWRAKRV